MTKTQYEKRCKELFERAASIGVKLDFDPKQFRHDRLNCLWSGGWYATVEVSPQLSIWIAVYGDVCAALFDENDNEVAYVKDKNNSGAFSRYMFPHIQNDAELRKFLNAGLLVLENNNWVEYGGLYYRNEGDKCGVNIDLSLITDNLLDNNVLEAISQVLNDVPEITNEILDNLPIFVKGADVA